jgi:hypothetical protein
MLDPATASRAATATVLPVQTVASYFFGYLPGAPEQAVD